ncbi:hypothetical protein HAX54_013308 [Datura stramonium]|uniref:Uncharacterized protein n=1 Tax=Datura stramonium TaxID=4076 RepID=A0ABS8Y9X2_DATST|nr:hypothetical protein [Datura stramonium]
MKRRGRPAGGGCNGGCFPVVRSERKNKEGSECSAGILPVGIGVGFGFGRGGLCFCRLGWRRLVGRAVGVERRRVVGERRVEEGKGGC